MKTQSAKAKGRKLQQWWRDKITETLGPYGVVGEDVTSTSMGAGGEDVVLSPFARKLLPISTECKSRKSMKTLYDWYVQANTNSGVWEPVVVIKADRKKPLVLVDAEHYLGLWGRVLSSEKTN